MRKKTLSGVARNYHSTVFWSLCSEYFWPWHDRYVVPRTTMLISITLLSGIMFWGHRNTATRVRPLRRYLPRQSRTLVARNSSLMCSPCDRRCRSQPRRRWERNPCTWCAVFSPNVKNTHKKQNYSITSNRGYYNGEGENRTKDQKMSWKNVKYNEVYK